MNREKAKELRKLLDDLDKLEALKDKLMNPEFKVSNIVFINPEDSVDVSYKDAITAARGAVRTYVEASIKQVEIMIDEIM